MKRTMMGAASFAALTALCAPVEAIEADHAAFLAKGLENGFAYERKDAEPQPAFNPTELKGTIEALNKGFASFKEAQEARDAEIKKLGDASAETKEKLDKIVEDLGDLADAKERLEAVELKLDRPRGPGRDGEDVSKEAVEHREAFIDFIRNPDSVEARNKLAAAQKAVTGVTDSGGTAGGYAVPEVISRNITRRVQDISPVRQVAMVETASTPDYKKLVDMRGAGYSWVGEGDTRSETGTPTLQEVAPTFGTIMAYPKASEESLNDIFFDVESWLVDNVSESFAKGEGIAFISGNGTKKPTGFLDGTPVSTADDDSPARAFGTLQYLPTGNASGFGELSTSSPFHYPSESLIDTVYSLQANYRGNARWMMNKSTLATVRKFKDSDGNYIWQPGLSQGQPQSLLGYGVVEAEDMPDVGSNAFPIAFGDFRRGYLIVDLVGLRITRDEVTSPGQVKWYVRRRVGGKLMDDRAIKLIKCAAS